MPSSKQSLLEHLHSLSSPLEVLCEDLLRFITVMAFRLRPFGVPASFKAGPCYVWHILLNLRARLSIIGADLTEAYIEYIRLSFLQRSCEGLEKAGGMIRGLGYSRREVALGIEELRVQLPRDDAFAAREFYKGEEGGRVEFYFPRDYAHMGVALDNINSAFPEEFTQVNWGDDLDLWFD